MILRLQHIGIVVRDLHDACARFERALGMRARDFRDDQGQGMQLDARIVDDTIHRFDKGLAACVHPDELPGMAVELVERF